jgi:hypothetical protein
MIVSVLRGEGGIPGALARLRVVRAGGSTTSPTEAEALLSSDGCEEVRSIGGDVPRGLRLIVGRRPATVGSGA